MGEVEATEDLEPWLDDSFVDDSEGESVDVRTGFPFRSDCQSEADLGSAYRLAPQSPGP